MSLFCVALIFKMFWYCFSLSYLVIVKTSGDNIVRYDIETGELDVLKGRDDFPQDVSVDGDNSIVYWVNYNSDASNYKIMSTSYTGETTDLNITYSNTIEIAQDELFLYVLDVSNEKIDKYKKSTWEQMGSMNVSSGTQGIEVAFGEYYNVTDERYDLSIE